MLALNSSQCEIVATAAGYGFVLAGRHRGADRCACPVPPKLAARGRAAGAVAVARVAASPSSCCTRSAYGRMQNSPGAGCRRWPFLRLAADVCRIGCESALASDGRPRWLDVVRRGKACRRRGVLWLVISAAVSALRRSPADAGGSLGSPRDALSCSPRRRSLNGAEPDCSRRWPGHWPALSRARFWWPVGPPLPPGAMPVVAVLLPGLLASSRSIRIATCRSSVTCSAPGPAGDCHSKQSLAAARRHGAARRTRVAIAYWAEPAASCCSQALSCYSAEQASTINSVEHDELSTRLRCRFPPTRCRGRRTTAESRP